MDAWTTPELRTLSINLDTAFGPGSNSDQDGSTSVAPPI